MVKIVLKQKTIALIRKYDILAEKRDHLSKSYDDRLLDLLKSEINLSEFGTVLGYIKRYISDLEYIPNHVHFSFRENTINYLYVYCFTRGYMNFNKGLYHLVEQAILKITAKNLKSELEVIEKITHIFHII